VAAAPDGRPGRHDPYWDLDGTGVRRARTRRRIVSSLAFVAALAACGAVAFGWAVKVGLLAALAVG
jgi:hypothetical protein